MFLKFGLPYRDSDMPVKLQEPSLLFIVGISAQEVVLIVRRLTMYPGNMPLVMSYVRSELSSHACF